MRKIYIKPEIENIYFLPEHYILKQDSTGDDKPETGLANENTFDEGDGLIEGKSGIWED